MNKKLLIATHNKEKLTQIKQILNGIPYTIVSLSDVGITDDVEETGTTFAENATLKATTYAKLSGLLTLADDSGLEVAALGGEPGVYSSRYAGPQASAEQKIAFLLTKMRTVPAEKRQARFACAQVLALPTGNPSQLYEGFSTGYITMEAQGKLMPQFPYCSVYVLDGYGKTIAQLQEENVPYECHRVRTMMLVKKDLLFKKNLYL